MNPRLPPNEASSFTKGNSMNQLNGFTIIELMLALAITSIITAASVPYFHTMNQNWNVIQKSVNSTQESRLALSIMEKELKQADRITSLSSTALYFVKSNGDTTGFLSADQGAKRVLSQELNGENQPLTGAIDSLLFEGIAADGTPTMIPSKLKAIRITLRINNQTMQTQVTFPKDFISTLYYGISSGNNLNLDGSGTIHGNIHANNAIQESIGNSIAIVGAETFSAAIIPVPLPTVDIDNILALYTDLSGYKAMADTVIIGDHTFTQNKTYSGFYYIESGTANIEKNVVIDGTVVAEGNIIINGHNVIITATGSNPALIAGNDLLHTSTIGEDFTTTGVIVAGRDILMTTKDIISQGNDLYNFTYVAGRMIDIDSRYLLANGGIVAGNSIILNQTQVLSISTSGLTPILTSGHDLSLTSVGTSTSLTGLVYSGNDFFSEKDTLVLNGTLIAEHDIQLSGDVEITNNPDDLNQPPIHFMEIEYAQ
jgi:prepilin-type N-terminal cleavage/methylation domain-containing protein